MTPDAGRSGRTGAAFAVALALLSACGGGGTTGGAGRVAFSVTLTGVGTRAVRAVAVGADGSSVVAGVWNGTIDLDPGPGVDRRSSVDTDAGDIFVLGLDPAGRRAFAFTLGDERLDDVGGVAMAPDGGFAITGRFAGTVDFDPGPGVRTLRRAGRGSDAFVGRYTREGGHVFSVPFTGHAIENYTARGARVAVTTGGAVLVSGVHRGDVDFDPGDARVTPGSDGDEDGFVARLGPGGSLDWVLRMTGSGDETAWLAYDPARPDTLWVAGSHTRSIDLDPGAGVDLRESPGDLGSYLVHLDDRGRLRWGGAFPATGGVAIADLASAPDGDALLVATAWGEADLDPRAGETRQRFDRPALVAARIGPAGDRRWHTALGVPEAGASTSTAGVRAIDGSTTVALFGASGAALARIGRGGTASPDATGVPAGGTIHVLDTSPQGRTAIIAGAGPVAGEGPEIFVARITY